MNQPRQPLVIPAPLRAVLDRLRDTAKPVLVGGCVRDWLRGESPKDFDVEVHGIDAETLSGVLAPFGSTDPVGKSFGVIKLRLGGTEYDIGLPRRETKIGHGHRGFSVGVDPHLGFAEALARRDFTVNAIAYDPFSDAIIDPHRGCADLRAGILRHTSPAFAEDPLRVLRAMQFAARFGFQLDASTADLCRRMIGTFPELPTERVWGEWEKWAARAARPSSGLEVLAVTGWLQHFPELAALRGVPQEPEWHPEGDVWVHTQHCVDALANLAPWKTLPPDERRDVMFAVLAHDFGKPATTVRAEKHGRIRWTSPGHEAAGGPIAETFLTRIGSPKGALPFVRALVENHFAHLPWPIETGPTATQVRRIARRLAPARLGHLLMVLRADHLGRPPRVCPDTARRIEQLEESAAQLALKDAEPKPILLGRHLIAHGLRPGADFRGILDAAFEAQLDGAFRDEAGALAWMRSYLALNQ